MVHEYTQQESGSKVGWTSDLNSRRAEYGKPLTIFAYIKWNS